MSTALQPVTAADRAHYQQQGYVHLKGVLPQSMLDNCQTLLEQWVDHMARTWRDAGHITDLKEHLPFDQRFYVLWQDAGRPQHDRSPRGQLVRLDARRVFDILSHPALLDAAEQLLDTHELVCHGVFNARPKAPSARFTDTPMHQDAQYFREEAGAGVMSAWFPLHPVDEDRSCLVVTPGYNSDHLFENDEGSGTGFIGIRAQDARLLERKPIPMQPGDLLCFNELTPHGAMPNRTDRMRWSMDARLVARETAHPAALEYGFIARSRSQSDITTFEQWLEKWKNNPGW